MIPWMLGRLERNPYAVFSQRELVERFPEEFQQARQDQMLKRATVPPGSGETGAFVHRSGRTYLVVPVPGGWEAFDDEDPEADPIRVTGEDLVQWKVDLAAFSRRVQHTNGLSGIPEELDSRLWFLGSQEYQDVSTGYLLGLLDSSTGTLQLLESLPVRLGYKFQRLVVACPSYVPSLEEGLGLATARISVTSFHSEEAFVFADSVSEIPHGQEKLTESGFSHSDDYRSVRWPGGSCALRPRQAQVVQALHQARRGGTGELSWEQLKVRLDLTDLRMRDLFRTSPAWQSLVVAGSGRGLYRLNI